MMFYLQDEYRYIVCQRMCVCVWAGGELSGEREDLKEFILLVTQDLSTVGSVWGQKTKSVLGSPRPALGSRVLRVCAQVARPLA